MCRVVLRRGSPPSGREPAASGAPPRGDSCRRCRPASGGTRRGHRPDRQSSGREPFEPRVGYGPMLRMMSAAQASSPESWASAAMPMSAAPQPLDENIDRNRPAGRLDQRAERRDGVHPVRRKIPSITASAIVGRDRRPVAGGAGRRVVSDPWRPGVAGRVRACAVRVGPDAGATGRGADCDPCEVGRSLPDRAASGLGRASRGFGHAGSRFVSSLSSRRMPCLNPVAPMAPTIGARNWGT